MSGYALAKAPRTSSRQPKHSLQLDLFAAFDAPAPARDNSPLSCAPVPQIEPEASAGSGNFYLSGDRALPAGWKARAEANLAAIDLAASLAEEGRAATLAEQQALSLFIGFGATELANGCFLGPGRTDYRDGWAEIGRRMEGLVTEAEHAALARGTQYAHFTPETIVRSIWDGLTRLGFRGGHILEPGIGTGLFASLLPEPHRERTHFTGIEADPVTARIAGFLLPEAEIRHEDFSLSKLDAGFALAVGNPPFSTRVVRTDPRYRRLGLRLHDFFIVKALDHVLPGGLAAFVTSQGTLDKEDGRVRAHIAESCDLVGAIRLPEGTFRASAGTDVGVDILFFRKHEADETPLAATWIATHPAGIPGHPRIRINRTFVENPAMVLGLHDAGRGPFGPDPVYACRAVPGQELASALADAVARLPEGVSTCSAAVSRRHVDGRLPDAATNDNARLREGSYFIADDGALMQIVEGAGEVVPLRAGVGTTGFYPKHAALIRALIPIRDAVRAVLARQEAREDSSTEQARLGEVYDAFVARHGPINLTTISESVTEATGKRTEAHRQPNLSPFRDDPDCWLVASIEHYDIETGEASKAAIFTGLVIGHEAAPDIASASDALARCLHELGYVDIPRIAALRGAGEDDVVDELGSALFRDPATDEWVTADEYLSGKVRVKLTEAVAAARSDPSFTRNVEALETVQPTDIPPSDITARLGAPWIPAETITEFARGIMRCRSAEVYHVPEAASWSINAWAFNDFQANARWGTPRYPCASVLLDALSARIPAIYDEVVNERGNKSRELNIVETEAAKEKLANLKSVFENWVWTDTKRCDRLARIYNDTYNDLVARRFDGSHLTLPGADAAFRFYPHQKNAIWRQVSAGSTYIAHAVGAGKSASLAAGIMEQRRLGLISKAIVTVPGHCLAQFAREFLALYPLARILVADEQNFAREHRRRFLARAATGEWDAIVITHSAFKFVPVPAAFERRLAQEMIDEYEALLNTINDDDRLTRKKVERMKESFRDRLDALASRKDDFLTMSELGFDQIIVDESQEFRKLSFSTNMATLKGVDPDGSQMAWDLYVKARYVRSRRAAFAGLARETVDRALILSSGTPITNTLGEMYTVQRFMDPDGLRERNLHEFDAWAAAFGETRTELELQPSGRYKPVTRFAEFVNVPELIAMFRSFADVVSAEDLKLLVKRPRIRGGKREILTAPPSEAFRGYQKVLDERIQAIEARTGPPQKGDDILLSVITDGRHAAIDLRFVLPGHGDEPGNKLNRMVETVHRIWAETANLTYLRPDGRPYDRPGATQMIFSDLGTPRAALTRGFSAYTWTRQRLIGLGVPASEIAFVHDCNGSKAKSRLFADMRSGKVRIVLGSTKKMGTGVNAQNRLKAEHHLDVPWLPSDIEQREGRIDRQGNQNEEIEIYAYATEGSMDATMWQANERKARFITAALSGDRSIRRLEDVGEGSVNQFAMAKAIASGDPRLMQKAGLEAEIARLERRRDAHFNEQHAFRMRLRMAEREIEEATRVVTNLDCDIAHRGPVDAPFVMSVNGADFTDRKDAGRALTDAMRRIDQEVLGKSVRGRGIEGRTIATFRGFEIRYTSRASADSIIADARLYTTGLAFELRCRSHTQGVVAVGQIEEVVDGLEGRRDSNREAIRHYEEMRVATEPMIGKAFGFQGELDHKRAELERIDNDLAQSEAA